LDPGAATVVLAAYAVGVGGLLLAATMAIAVGRDALIEWLGDNRTWLDRIAGVALVFAGIGQLIVAL
jgi:cytochrome c-type biogenesis protein